MNAESDAAKQKFNKGDLVKLDEEMPKFMSHFQAGGRAIVDHSYHERYGGSIPNGHQYSIYLEGRGECAWYYESQLTLIEENRGDLLEEWKEEAKKEADQASDLDWIFSHGKSIMSMSLHGATIAALAKCFTDKSLWGSRGEGIDYHQNSRATLNFAMPFLLTKDKEGWLKACEEYKKQKEKKES